VATPSHCRMCERAMRPRRDMPGAVGVKHAGRGLCESCRLKAARRGTLNLYQPIGLFGGKRALGARGRPASHTAEDFAFLVQQNGGERADTLIGWSPRTRRLAAQRLGIRQAALDRALYRDAQKRAA
jgi:hypothetical protein